MQERAGSPPEYTQITSVSFARTPLYTVLPQTHAAAQFFLRKYALRHLPPMQKELPLSA